MKRSLRPFLRLCAVAALVLLPGCSPISSAVRLVLDGVYTVSESRRVGDVVSDNRIKLELNKRMLEDSFALFRQVDTVVYQGRVMLIGSVPSPERKIKAEMLAWESEGVKEVINELLVGEAGDVLEFASDYIKEKTIQAALLLDDAVDSANYRVRVLRGRVYLMGHAANRAEMNAALRIARQTDGVIRVVSYMDIEGIVVASRKDRNRGAAVQQASSGAMPPPSEAAREGVRLSSLVAQVAQAAPPGR
jgi:osmotically-inducible protein OsmY